MSIDAAEGYFPGLWSAEDGGPRRLQSVDAALNFTGRELSVTRRRLLWGNMLVLRKPGEVYLMQTEILRSKYLGLNTSCRIEKIDPFSLKPLCSSGKLKSGPFWPGGFAAHRNGDLYAVFGNTCHRLDENCNLIRSKTLPELEAYNSFVILDNGLLVMKNFSDTKNAMLTVLDPETMEPVQEHLSTGEPSISRLSAAGNSVYVVGIKTIKRFNWNQAQQTLIEDDWSTDYIGDTKQTYGWDPVITETDAWFMDNGKHGYFNKMLGAGKNPTPNRLLRVPLDIKNQVTPIQIAALPYGSVTNPPVFASDRSIVLAYDSGNGIFKAFRYDSQKKTVQPLWEKKNFGVSSHMIYFQKSGELVTNDYKSFSGDSVVLDIETGTEISRVPVKNFFQGVIFPAPGWNEDYYYITFDRLIRVGKRQ